MNWNRFRIAVAVFAVSLALPAIGPSWAADAPIEDALLQEKCSLCHSNNRIFNMDPAKIKETVERMRKMSPDWISTIQSDHLAEVLAKVVNDPNVVAARTAWNESLDRGEALFKNTALGQRGVSCTDCHKSEDFHQVADSYPRWDANRKRFLTLDETIVVMLREKVGADLAAPDQRVIDLLIYLKTR